MKYKSYKFESNPRDYKLKVAFELLLEYLQGTDKNTKQLTLYDFQERVNKEYEATSAIENKNKTAKYIGDTPDHDAVKRYRHFTQ